MHLQNSCDMNSSSTSVVDVDGGHQIGFRGLLRYFTQQNPPLMKTIEDSDQQDIDIHCKGILFHL